jgi:hypothetical protein
MRVTAMQATSTHAPTQELEVVPLAHWAGLGEVLVGVASEAGAHEDVEHVVHVGLLQPCGSGSSNFWACYLGQRRVCQKLAAG